MPTYKQQRITEEAHAALREEYVRTGERLTTIASNAILQALRHRFVYHECEKCGLVVGLTATDAAGGPYNCPRCTGNYHLMAAGVSSVGDSA